MTFARIGLTTPALEKRKTCEKCHQEFLCKSAAARCWCEEIHLTAAAREEISSRYSDCLCRECLERFADTVFADKLDSL